jgi:hypothetical protein
MKRMWILLFALVVCFSMMSFAQSTGSDSQSGSGMHHGQGGHDRMMMDPQAMVAHLDQELSLTSDQKTKITNILENTSKQSQALMSNNSGDKKANHEAMRQLHENTHAQIRAALNPDQQTKFDAMMKQQQERMNGRHHKDKDSTTTTTTDNPK